MVEGTGRQRWVDLIFGLTEGWWKFADTQLRPSYPLLSVAQWSAVLPAAGFPEIATIPADDNGGAIFGQSIILAQRSNLQAVPQPKKPRWLIFADGREFGTQIAARLHEIGRASCRQRVYSSER